YGLALLVFGGRHLLRDSIGDDHADGNSGGERDPVAHVELPGRGNHRPRDDSDDAERERVAVHALSPFASPRLTFRSLITPTLTETIPARLARAFTTSPQSFGTRTRMQPTTIMVHASDFILPRSRRDAASSACS